MDEINDYFLNQRNYDQMVELAKKIHPDMQVRLNGFDQNQWEMFMPTRFTEAYQLDEKFKGTAAWEMHESRDASYDNELERYRYKNGHSGIPLDGVAELVNLSAEESTWWRDLANRLHAQRGTGIADNEWQTVAEAKFRAYQKTEKEAHELMQAEFADKRKALHDKWGF